MSKAPSHNPPAVAGDTVGALIEWGSQQLESAGVSFGHGTTNAHDEACLLYTSDAADE